ncbi:hypothetical protein T492DRAFT_942586 [Pavlovales sp. CCMP2436]|nr:hypothetical protein T492DRAFT_942586 [Pavlovales sp. CCMP2436]|mmetsp:Transcript_42586/g.104905  ORF Transcript_42586/g.104905 Transcript_42586/m.104905 type:complete len:255 (+) Transcript_42586:111-875(+)
MRRSSSWTLSWTLGSCVPRTLGIWTLSSCARCASCSSSWMSGSTLQTRRFSSRAHRPPSSRASRLISARRRELGMRSSWQSGQATRALCEPRSSGGCWSASCAPWRGAWALRAGWRAVCSTTRRVTRCTVRPPPRPPAFQRRRCYASAMRHSRACASLRRSSRGSTASAPSRPCNDLRPSARPTTCARSSEARAGDSARWTRGGEPAPQVGPQARSLLAFQGNSCRCDVALAPNSGTGLGTLGLARRTAARGRR